MATSVETERVAPAAQLDYANRYHLRLGNSKISYTVSNIASDPLVGYDNGSVVRNFIGDEINRERTDLGILVTVTLELVPDGTKRLLTLVVPEVLVRREGPPQKVNVPVVFHSLLAGDPRPRPKPGPLQTYEVQIFSGEADRIFT